MDKWMLRDVRDCTQGELVLTGKGYEGEWDTSAQIPRRALQEGSVDSVGFVGPDLGGETKRYAINAAFNAPGYKINVYRVDYDFSLFNNFSYLLGNPTQGDKFEQRDQRRVTGANYSGRKMLSEGTSTERRWELSIRHDDISDMGL